jgi:hypothetical protein
MQFARLLEEIEVNTTVLPQSITGDTDGAAVDCQGYDEILCVVHYGTTTETTPATSNMLHAVIQDSADNSAWAAVATANMVGAAVNLWAELDATDKDAQIFVATCRVFRRYVRIHIEETGTHNGTPVAAQIIGRVKEQPGTYSTGES